MFTILCISLSCLNWMRNWRIAKRTWDYKAWGDQALCLLFWRVWKAVQLKEYTSSSWARPFKTICLSRVLSAIWIRLWFKKTSAQVTFHVECLLNKRVRKDIMIENRSTRQVLMRKHFLLPRCYHPSQRTHCSRCSYLGGKQHLPPRTNRTHVMIRL